MKRLSFVILMLLLALSACGQDTAAPSAESGGQPISAEATAPAEPEHTHQPAGQPQLIERNTPGGYCGNTVTAVRPYGTDADSDALFSFWGSDSVALTDLLLTLDYSEGLCRCLPEYTVDTEFGTDYGVSLSQCYVRHEGAQAALTEEQAVFIRDILERSRT